MYTYNDLYQTCDEVLTVFINVEQRMQNITVYHLVNRRKTLIDAALSELVEKKCLTKESNAIEKSFTLIGLGRQIYDSGGFKEYLKELNQQSNFKKILDEYSLKTNESVIDTNTLVAHNVRTQERLTKYALTIALIAAAVPLITLMKEIVSPEQPIDKMSKSLMLQQQSSIDSLRKNLESVNGYLKQLKYFSLYIDSTKTK